MKIQFPFSSFCAVLIMAGVVAAQVPSKSGDWPQWRGPNRDGISTDKGLLKEWPADGPKVLWQVDTVGVGYSSLAIKDGRIFTQGDLNGVEHILALDVKDGGVLWAVQPKPVAEKLAERIEGELKRLDQNGDGKVDETEALARLGWNFNKYDQPVEGDREQLAARRAASIFHEHDKDSNERLDFSEIGVVLREHFERCDTRDADADVDTIATQRAMALIKALDKDADGQISRDESRRSELERAFNSADVRDPTTRKGDQQLTTEEIEQYFIKRQAGKDGVLTSEELSGYLVRNTKGDGVLTAKELQGMYGGYRNGQGDGPRGTPTVDGDKVYVEGGNGDVTCLDAATGKTVWHVSLGTDFGGGRPGWGYSESPLVEGNLLIITPGGKNGTLAALDKYTGARVWQTEATKQSAHYSSPVAADIGGIRQIVQFGRNSAFAVTAAGGELLWEYSNANNGTANCCTPIIEDNLVFVSSSYGTGGGLAKITSEGGKQKAEEIYFEKKLACHHGGIVKIGDHMYTCGGGTLMCNNFKTGETAWQARSVGKGSLVAADGMLYVLSENQQVALVEATPEQYIERGRFKTQSHGRRSWAHPVVAGGRLYLRDWDVLLCYDVSAP